MELKKVERAVEDRVDQIIDEYEGEKSSLIQILLDVQAEYNWLPMQAMERIGQRLEIPLGQVLRVATFYKAFSITPKGRHLIKVCLGTSCHVRQAPRLMERIEQVMGIKDGETTPDHKFTLESVRCVGACALGPIFSADGKYHHGQLSAAKLKEIFADCD